MPREVKNAVIRRTEISIEHVPSAWIHLDYGLGSQGFGGYHLGGPYMHAFVEGVLKALGQEEWEKLAGVSCRVDADGGKVYRIGHFLKDTWFDPEFAFAALSKQWTPNLKEQANASP